jgi:hypothetical protein
VRRECVHPRNLLCRHSPNDPPVPRNSPKNLKPRALKRCESLCSISA